MRCSALLALSTISFMRPPTRLLTHLAAATFVLTVAACGNDVASKADFVNKMDSISVMKGIKWDCVYDALKPDHSDAIADLMVAEPGALPPGMSALVSPMMATCAGLAIPSATPTTALVQLPPSESSTSTTPTTTPTAPAR